MTLSETLEVTGRAAADSFGEAHAQLERQRVLDHPLDQCPWQFPPVRKWTPAKGWEEVR